MFCFKCGAEISDESDFCMKCGTEILHHNKTEIEEVNSISTIPMNATIKSAFVSTIIVSETEISYKSGLKSETIKVSDISDIRYTAGTPSENGRLFITANGKSYNVMFFFNNNKKIAELCGYFSALSNNTFIPMEVTTSTSSQTGETQHEEKTLSKRQRIKENKKNGIACCPKCGSTSLTANKKGFGVGKAVIGTAVAGPIGLVAGNKGEKKVRITCLNCGNQWWA